MVKHFDLQSKGIKSFKVEISKKKKKKKNTSFLKTKILVEMDRINLCIYTLTNHYEKITWVW